VSIEIAGQVAVVTGAGRGIGRETALLLAKHGVKIVAAARSVDELEETAAEVRALGSSCLVAPTDVTDEAQVERLFDQAEAKFGGIDIAIVNAGTGQFMSVAEMPTEVFDRTLNVNLRGAFFCCRAAAQRMIPRRSGSIVTVSSSSGKKPYPTQGAYCASKFGLVGLSKVLAMELRPFGIRVHTVCPGGVETQLASEIHPNRDKTGWIQPQDIAESILYLLTLPRNITADEIILRRFDADPM